MLYILAFFDVALSSSLTKLSETARALNHVLTALLAWNFVC